jgi:tRNA A37 threonylcarbamoyladenosine modification protein TsaB
MIVLGIDTSSYANAIGVVDSEKILADKSFDARTDSLEQIVDNIDTTLKSARLTLDAPVPGRVSG